MYSDPVQDEFAVHNLEHGGIWVSYKDIDEQTIQQLEFIARENPNSVLLSPRENNDAKIVLASWGRMQQLDTLDQEMINRFIKANINNSPEPLAR